DVIPPSRSASFAQWRSAAARRYQILFHGGTILSRWPPSRAGVPLDLIVTKPVTVVNPQGFHARPAHLFVKMAASFQAQVEILKGNEVINGKSILDLLTLGAGNGTTLTLRANGPDAQAAVEALARLI